MKTVKFKDVPVDTNFTSNGVEYKKTVDKRVSCCKTINAVVAADEKQSAAFKPLTDVEVNE